LDFSSCSLALAREASVCDFFSRSATVSTVLRCGAGLLGKYLDRLTSLRVTWFLLVLLEELFSCFWLGKYLDKSMEAGAWALTVGIVSWDLM